MAATVSKPSGGKEARLATKRSTFLKLQNVSGVCGLTRRIFIRPFQAFSGPKTFPNVAVTFCK